MVKIPGKAMVDKEDYVVRPDQLPPCIGVAGFLCRFKKFDDLTRFEAEGKWRCRPCNKIYWEFRYSETKVKA